MYMYIIFLFYIVCYEETHHMIIFLENVKVYQNIYSDMIIYTEFDIESHRNTQNIYL